MSIPGNQALLPSRRDPQAFSQVAAATSQRAGNCGGSEARGITGPWLPSILTCGNDLVPRRAGNNGRARRVRDKGSLSDVAEQTL
jgi:hypothetical protein